MYLQCCLFVCSLFGLFVYNLQDSNAEHAQELLFSLVTFHVFNTLGKVCRKMKKKLLRLLTCTFYGREQANLIIPLPVTLVQTSL